MSQISAEDKIEASSSAVTGVNNQHAMDANARRRAALAEIDNAKFGWFHVKACLVAGAGFFTDAYDIFAINIASVMLGYVFEPSGALSPTQDLGLKVATPVGTLVGQLLFGWLADVYGRKRIYGIELMIIIVATLAQAVTGNGPTTSYLGVLIMWRFIMGVGIGGDYPLSAIITSEFAATRIRGRMMTAVFAMQGFGNLAAAIVGIIVVRAYASNILSDPANTPSVDHCWRLLIGLGCVPGVVALYFRLTIPETPRFTMDIERDIVQAATDVDDFLKSGNFNQHDYEGKAVKVEAPRATLGDFFHYFSKLENAKILFGTSWSWFALDVAFYGLGLNSSIVLSTIGFGSPVSGTPQEKVLTNLTNICVGNIILSVAGLVPGYWAAFFLIDSWGRKPLQLYGFVVLTVLFIILGFAYTPLVNNAVGAFIFLYCLTNFFQNFGPNTTTFVIPGELFPTRYRSTAHGFSAASGKLGAIISQIFVFYTKDIGGKNAWLNHLLQVFALFMLTGIGSTLFLPETKGQSLEELSNETQDGFIREAAPRAPVAAPTQSLGVDEKHQV